MRRQNSRLRRAHSGGVLHWQSTRGSRLVCGHHLRTLYSGPAHWQGCKSMRPRRIERADSPRCGAGSGRFTTSRWSCRGLRRCPGHELGSNGCRDLVDAEVLADPVPDKRRAFPRTSRATSRASRRAIGSSSQRHSTSDRGSSPARSDGSRCTGRTQQRRLRTGRPPASPRRHRPDDDNRLRLPGSCGSLPQQSGRSSRLFRVVWSRSVLRYLPVRPFTTRIHVLPSGHGT